MADSDSSHLPGHSHLSGLDGQIMYKPVLEKEPVPMA